MYEVLKPATGLEVGETYSPEDLAAKGDVPTMLRKGIVRPVGFLSLGQPMADSEAARLIQDLQEKLDAMEKERDAARDEVKALGKEKAALLAGHKEGSRQLNEALNLVREMEEENERLRKGEKVGAS
jgi:uncharacterized protein (DUF3084 family)